MATSVRSNVVEIFGGLYESLSRVTSKRSHFPGRSGMDEGFRMESSGETHFEQPDWEGKVKQDTLDSGKYVVKVQKGTDSSRRFNITYFWNGRFQPALRSRKCQAMTASQALQFVFISVTSHCTYSLTLHQVRASNHSSIPGSEHSSWTTSSTQCLTDVSVESVPLWRPTLMCSHIAVFTCFSVCFPT